LASSWVAEWDVMTVAKKDGMTVGSWALMKVAHSVRHWAAWRADSLVCWMVDHLVEKWDDAKVENLAAQWGDWMVDRSEQMLADWWAALLVAAKVDLLDETWADPKDVTMVVQKEYTKVGKTEPR
jgi:hypothetical protein